MIPIHPQPCPGGLRWITPAHILPFTGAPATVPAPIAALLDDGTLAAVHVEANAVVTTLADGRHWSQDGARVRSALHAALEDPAGWTAGDAAPTRDDQLREAAESLLNGQVGELALSHGGSIRLLDARDGVVTVKLDGACHGCPAAAVTLRQNFETQLRRRCPDLRTVVTDT
jgi:Fe-S cluster biogenesis protein NfuA